MNLGLDISTTAIGIALVDENEKILVSEVLKMESKLSLEDRAANLKDHVKKIVIEYPDIKKVFVEAPIVLFSGGSHAHTVSLLQRFNGMCCLAMYQLFQETPPTLVNATSARSKLGIKIKRGKKTKHQKKQPIIDFVESKYKDSDTPFIYEITRKGNFKPGTDDRADALILALAGPKFT